ncbi:MAG TPA: AAA family ATPase, partial [Streptosporangiaceae bacterium]
MASLRTDDVGADEVLAAERDHLTASRGFLRLMREDVMSLPAMAGDEVSREYLKRDLYRRAESLKDLPDAPLFFGRLDYQSGGTRPAPPSGPDKELSTAGEQAGESFHIGRRHVHDRQGHPVVIDWRAPVSRPFYRARPSDPMGLIRRRRFGFSGGELTAFED